MNEETAGILRLTEQQRDALKEAGSIGAGHAAIALSQLLGKRVGIAVTKVEVVPSNEFERFIGGPEGLVAAVYLTVLGEMRAGALLLFRREDAFRLADLLMRREKGKTLMLSETEQSAIKEAGNIITGSYLSTLSLLISFKVALSVPKFAFDFSRNVVTGALQEVLPAEEKSVSLVTEFLESSAQIKGIFAFIPAKESLEKILRGLKVK